MLGEIGQDDGRAGVDFEAMPSPVAEAFFAYCALPERRSLQRLAAMYRARGNGPAVASLKRYSAKYRWQERAHAHDLKTVGAMEERFNEAMGDRIRSDVQAIAAAKQRFYDRCVDPDDPALTPAQRRRALSPTLTDFVRLLKIEGMLLASIPEVSKLESAGDKKSNFTEEEVAVMMNALTRFRHNLPPPQ